MLPSWLWWLCRWWWLLQFVCTARQITPSPYLFTYLLGSDAAASSSSLGVLLVVVATKAPAFTSGYDDDDLLLLLLVPLFLLAPPPPFPLPSISADVSSCLPWIPEILIRSGPSLLVTRATVDSEPLVSPLSSLCPLLLACKSTGEEGERETVKWKWSGEGIPRHAHFHMRNSFNCPTHSGQRTHLAHHQSHVPCPRTLVDNKTIFADQLSISPRLCPIITTMFECNWNFLTRSLLGYTYGLN